MTLLFFFFNDTATTEIYTLSLHDALPISFLEGAGIYGGQVMEEGEGWRAYPRHPVTILERENRSEEHTSELQSRLHLVCRLLLEKKMFVGYDLCLHSCNISVSHPVHIDVV